VGSYLTTGQLRQTSVQVEKGFKEFIDGTQFWDCLSQTILNLDLHPKDCQDTACLTKLCPTTAVLMSTLPKIFFRALRDKWVQRNISQQLLKAEPGVSWIASNQSTGS